MTDERVEKRIRMASNDDVAALFGNFDENLKTLESELEVLIVPRESDLLISGQVQGVEVAAEVIDKLSDMLRSKEHVDKGRIRYAIELAREGNANLITEIMTDVLIVTHRGKQVKCKTMGQKKFVNAVRANTMVFAVGPAGTGKTCVRNSPAPSHSSSAGSRFLRTISSYIRLASLASNSWAGYSFPSIISVICVIAPS